MTLMLRKEAHLKLTLQRRRISGRFDDGDIIEWVGMFPHEERPSSTTSKVGRAVEHEDIREKSFLDCIKHLKSSIANSWKKEE